jgi:hypothetical protein
MIKTKFLTLVFVGTSFMLSTPLVAQEETRYEGDTTENGLEEPFSPVQILRLKKSYVLGDGITFKSAQGNLNVNQTLQTTFLMNSANKNLSNPSSEFAINRARLNIFGNIFDNKISFSGRLNFSSNYQSATGGNRSFNTVLQEANIEYRPNRTHAINFGLRADYIDSRETRIEGESIGFINRSAVSEAFDAIFDYGIRYKGTFNVGKNRWFKTYASITSGDSRSGLQRNYGGFKYGVRIDYLPFGKFARFGEFYMDDLYREEKPKLVIGVVYSYNESATSATGTNGGRWLYADATRNSLLPSYRKFGADYLFKYNGFYSLGSFVSTHANVPNGIKGEYRLNGTFITYPTTQTEDQTKNIVLSRLNLGSGFNTQVGYVFQNNWSLSGRYSFLNADGFGTGLANENKYYSMVATKYLSGHNLKLQFEVGYNELKQSLKTTTQNGTYYSQIQFTIQL